MRKTSRKRSARIITKNQPYDTTLKSLVEGHEQEVLSFFLPGIQYVETLNIEVLRTPLRVDRVYKVLYRGEIYILHIEFESSADGKIASRLLEYHVYFYNEYYDKGCYPVISVIVYPFRTAMPISPWREMHGDKEVLTFHFHVIALCDLDAAQYVRDRALYVYAFLPAMNGANAAMILQAIDEMVEYYKHDEKALANQLKWLGVLLRRADILSVEDKRKVKERLDMWDNLLEQDPYIQNKIASAAKAAAKAAAETATKAAEARGLEAMRDSVVSVARVRFPRLAEVARKRVQNIEKIDELEELHDQLLLAPDEVAARKLLNPPSA